MNKHYASNDRNCPSSHQCEVIPIKKAQVDLRVQPLVKYLNSFSGVFTRWSCDGGEIPADMYIAFYCDSNSHLHEILREIGVFINLEVDLEPSETTLRYRLSLRSTYKLEDINEYLVQEGLA